MILLDNTVGRLTPSYGPVGVIPANFAALGTSPSPLANDADLPADANTQWLWVLLSPLPVGGTTEANDEGGYAFFGAPPPGVYTQGYRGFTLSTSGVVVVYDQAIETTVGSGVGTVQQDRTLSWSVRAVVSRDQGVAWAVRNSTQRDLALSWSVEQPYVTADLTLTLNTMGTAQASQVLSYGIRAGVQRDRPLRWAVRSSLVSALTRLKLKLQINTTIN